MIMAKGSGTGRELRKLTRSDQATTPGHALARQNTLPLVPLLPVGAEQVGDLASTDTDVTGRHVRLGTDVLAQPPHEGVAESPDLAVALALGVEVRSSLATSHVD